MAPTNILRQTLAVALLSGSVSALTLGLGAATARAEAAPCPREDGRCGTPYQWCPTNPSTGMPDPLPENGIDWDMTSCHWYWYTPGYLGNVGPHTTETGAP